MKLERLNRVSLRVSTLIVSIFLTASAAFADCPNQVTPSGGDPLQMLVLGDSIMWGQGLRDEEKFSSRVKCWLQEQTNREVRAHVEAHSGAVISGAALAQPTFTTSDGEVNLTSPTINEQLDHAIQFYKQNEATPALILLNGCINDIGVKNLLAASTPLEDLRTRVRQSCGEKMQLLLQRVRNSFPQSLVVVTGYYPIVSLQTADTPSCDCW